MGNLKISDNAYDVLSLDESVGLLKKSFWQKLTAPKQAPEIQDCDDEAIAAMMRARARHTGKLPPAIGYAAGMIDGGYHAVNLIVTPDEIWFWDDGCNQVLLPGNEVSFIWM